MRVNLLLGAAMIQLVSGCVVGALDLGLESSARLASAPPDRKPAAKKPKSFEKECLAAHNRWRRLHQAAPLKIDHKLAAFARKRADFIARSDGAEFRHPRDLEYGENLAWHSRNSSGCAKLVKMWYDELPLYSFERPLFTHETGHFSQLVWNGSERVGCASAVSAGPRGGVYLVCNYDPPGNYLGEFEENVRPARPAVGPTSVSTSAPPPPPSSSTTTSSTSRPLEPTSVEPAPASSSSNSTEPASGPNRNQNKAKKKKRKNKKKKKKAAATTTSASASASASTSTSTSTPPPPTTTSSPTRQPPDDQKPKDADTPADKRKRRRTNSTRELDQRQPTRRRREHAQS